MTFLSIESWLGGNCDARQRTLLKTVGNSPRGYLSVTARFYLTRTAHWISFTLYRPYSGRHKIRGAFAAGLELGISDKPRGRQRRRLVGAAFATTAIRRICNLKQYFSIKANRPASRVTDSSRTSPMNNRSPVTTVRQGLVVADILAPLKSFPFFSPPSRQWIRVTI